MKRGEVKEKIFVKNYEGIRCFIPFGDFPTGLLPTDLVSIDKQDGFYSDNNSCDDRTVLTIIRLRPETDEEFKKVKSSGQSWQKKVNMNALKDFKN